MTATLLGTQARLVLDLIGSGFRLRVPFDRDGQSGVDSATVVNPRLPGIKLEVSRPFVEELLKSQLLYRITEEPNGNRAGWRDSGLDGENAAFYCMVI